MTKRCEFSVLPLVDKYYTYILFKPDGVPFYVGKGRGNRVNDHFKKSFLKTNTPKTGIIKKYGNSIKREIVAYFDTEDSAYEFEEYLIAYYGVISEGGTLVNYAKTRFQYSSSFSEIASSGSKFRRRIYSRDTVLSSLYMFYVEGKNKNEVSKESGIPLNYLGPILRGKKCVEDYRIFLEECDRNGTVLLPFEGRVRSKKEVTVPDSIILECYENLVKGHTDIRAISKKTGLTTFTLEAIFNGHKRRHLNLKMSRDRVRKVVKGRLEESILTVVRLRLAGESYSSIVTATGIPKTVVARICKAEGTYRYLKPLFEIGNDNSSLNTENTA